MSKNTVFVIGVVVIALLFSSVPVLVPFLFGMGNQSGAISPETTHQLLNSVLFIGITKISGLSLFVSIVGLALSIYFQRSNPKKFRLTSIAFGLFLIGVIISGFLSAWIDIGSVQAGAAQSQTAMGYSAITCISSLFQIAAWVLLFIVIFSPKNNESANNV
jgi:hypothetical protein